MTPPISNIFNTLQTHKSLLMDEYNLSQIGIFGSYAHNSQTHSSDVDILIDVEKPMGLFKFVHLNLCLVVQACLLCLVLQLLDSFFALFTSLVAFLFVSNFLRGGYVRLWNHVSGDMPLEFLILKVLVHAVLQLTVANADVDAVWSENTIDLAQHLKGAWLRPFSA